MPDVRDIRPTIPKCIHQTWKNHDLPVPAEWPASWKSFNPDWDYRFWTDDDLLQLVTDHYPHLLELYQSYSNGVQRADLGRYLVLDHCGGVYADIDTQCFETLDPLAQDTRVVLSLEPVEHHHHALSVGMEHLVFNGVMASPKGHAFWKHMVALVVRSRHAKKHVLESTGPLVLTAAVNTYADPRHISINSCHIFNPLTDKGRMSVAGISGDYGHRTFCHHYWENSWFDAPTGGTIKRLKLKARRLRYKLTRGPYLSKSEVAAGLDKSVLYQPISDADRNVSILIPVRDAEPFLDRCFALLLALDYPKEQIKIVFCEGDSIDGTRKKLEAFALAHRDDFRNVQVLGFETGSKLDRKERWKPKLQKARRSDLAKVRNHLIENGFDEQDHWALWLDADVCDYDSGILNRLLRERAKVVTPDCVLEWDGVSYDMNAFAEDSSVFDYKFYKHVHRGLYMPPSASDRRRHLSGFRCLDRVPLNSVGGTMLLVHGSVLRGGIRFPERPYDHLLETEGFGRMCFDFGITPIGLPNVQIRHVRS